MRHYIAASVATTLLASTALASGLDRTGQPIGVIFEEGNYAEFSFATTSPDVSGNDRTSLNPLGSATGDVGERFNMLGGAYKTDITEELSLAIIYDQPWGVDINYPVGGSALLGGTTAQADSNAITALLRYKLNDRFSVHGGLRYQEIDGSINLAERRLRRAPRWHLQRAGQPRWGIRLGRRCRLRDPGNRSARRIDL